VQPPLGQLIQARKSLTGIYASATPKENERYGRLNDPCLERGFLEHPIAHCAKSMAWAVMFNIGTAEQ